MSIDTYEIEEGFYYQAVVYSQDDIETALQENQE
jgi:hypothetical protein